MLKHWNLMMTNRHFKDLNPIIAGAEDCEPGHSYGPAVRKYTLLHYVVSGKGCLQTGGSIYSVGKGEVFRILPGEITVYKADEADPWSYIWLGFDGELSAKFATLPPVFPLPAGASYCFTLDENEGASPEFHLASKLFRLYAELFCSAPSGKSNYVRRVQNYIAASYMQPIRVEEIAGWMNLDRRYLSRLFRQKTGQTVREYLISVRMAEATRCLANGLPVCETAERCGYPDMFLFSKMFKKYYGISPANWKKAHSGTPPEDPNSPMPD